MNLCNIQNLRRFWMRNLPFSPWRMLNWAKIHVPHYARVVVRQLPISNLLSCLGTGRLIFVRSHSPSGATIISTTWSFHLCWRLTVCKKIRKYTSYSPILQSLYCPVLFTILKKKRKIRITTCSWNLQKKGNLHCASCSLLPTIDFLGGPSSILFLLFELVVPMSDFKRNYLDKEMYK